MSDSGAAQRLVTELKVSGHLMTLDTGLFCVFHTPGSLAAEDPTGLPGVRLSPHPSGPSDALRIATFREDGWLGGRDTAALIRVTNGPAQVLVTVYQMPDGRHEAPRLQVLRLSEGDAVPAIPGAPQPVPAQAQPSQAQPPQVQPSPPPMARPEPVRAAAPPPPPAPPPQPGQGTGQATGTGGAQGVSPEVAEIAAHVQGRGDVLCRIGDWMGDRGSGRWVEGFAVAPRGPVLREDIEYQAVLGRGWLSPWAEGGQYCGSRGMALPILGLRVRLRGEKAQHYAVRVAATFVDGSVAGPVEDGGTCESESLAPLEAFVIEVVAQGQQARRPQPEATPPAREGVRREMAYEAPVARQTRAMPARAASARPVPARPATPAKPAARAPAKPAPAPRTTRATPAAEGRARAAPARPAPAKAAAAKPRARADATPARGAKAPARPRTPPAAPGRGKPPRGRR